MTTQAMIGKGTCGGFKVISVRTQSGAAPPGVGSAMIARPNQTKLIPSVTTMEGRLRQWMSAPISP